MTYDVGVQESGFKVQVVSGLGSGLRDQDLIMSA